MDAKQAATTAKKYFEEVFSEKPSLEEIWFDPDRAEWCVTLGRRRMVRERSGMIPDIYAGTPVQEIIDYKVVRISDEDGSVKSVRLREDDCAA